MTRNEVIARYCNLAAEVYHRFGDYGHANDCICAHRAARPRADENFRCDGQIVEWIERTVRKALELDLAVLDKAAADADEGDA